MRYKGDFTEDATVYIDFTTNDSSGGAVAPSSALEAADVTIYKNGSATEKTSTNGLTMTSPFDSIVGYHLLSVDTSNDTGDSGFWVAGADYTVILNPDETIDGQTVVGIIGTFSIENRFDEVDVTKISGDATAADNLEAQFDGTGVSGETFPSTQSQLSGIANVGSAVNRPADSYTLTTGTQSANTYTATEALDGVNHEHTDDTGVLDLYYEFNIGSGLASSVQVTGYINGVNDSVDVYGYDWVAAAWVQIGTLVGQALTSNQVNSYDMFVDMVGSGANAGVVRVRFYQASGLTTATLAIDQIFVAFNQTAEGYQNAAVWLDTNASNTNTVKGVDGTASNPVSTMAAVNTLLASTNLSKVEIIAGSTVTLAASQNNQVFSGENWSLALGGQDINGSTFIGATVSGTTSGVGTLQKFLDCSMGAVTLLKNTHVHGSAITATQTQGEAGDIFYDNCHSGIAGTDTWVFDFGAAVGDSNFNLRHYSGGVQFESMGDTGTDTASVEGHGQIIEGTCTDGTVAIRGNFTVSGITNLTLVDGARFESSQLVDDFWDEVITSGAHNINNSGAKILRELKELPGYEGGFIYIDTVGGSAGSEKFVNGVLDNPVDSIADANTLAASTGIRSFKIISGSSITFAASQENQEFVGESWTLALGGQSISGTAFHGADISGIGTGTTKPHFTHCELNGVTIPPCSAFASSLTGALVLGSAGSYFFHSCYSGVAGTGTPSIDFGAIVGDNAVNLRQYSGGVEIKNMGQTGTDNASIEGNGQIITNANCSGGMIATRGNFTVTDNSSGAVIFSDDARFDIAQSVKNITGRIPATLVSGRMDSNISAINNDNDAAVRMALAQIGLEPGAAVAGTLTVTEMTTDLTEDTDDHYNGRVIVWTSGVLARQATNITDYDGATKKLTYTTTTEPAAIGDTFMLY